MVENSVAKHQQKYGKPGTRAQTQSCTAGLWHSLRRAIALFVRDEFWLCGAAPSKPRPYWPEFIARSATFLAGDIFWRCQRRPRNSDRPFP
jgi:hypothetical protein